MKKRVQIVCQTCQKIFEVIQSERAAKFCSKKCMESNLEYRQELKEKTKKYWKEHPERRISQGEKISKKLRGRVLSEETKEKCRQASTGRKHTEETKKKMSLERKGKICSKETIEKMTKNVYVLYYRLDDSRLSSSSCTGDGQPLQLCCCGCGRDASEQDVYCSKTSLKVMRDCLCNDACSACQSESELDMLSQHEV